MSSFLSLSFLDLTIGKFWRTNYYYHTFNDIFVCLQNIDNKINTEKIYETDDIKNEIFKIIIKKKIIEICAIENKIFANFIFYPFEKLDKIFNPPKNKFLLGISFYKEFHRYVYVCYDSSLNKNYGELMKDYFYPSCRRENKIDFKDKYFLPPLLITLKEESHDLKNHFLVKLGKDLFKHFNYDAGEEIDEELFENLKTLENMTWTKIIHI